MLRLRHVFRTRALLLSAAAVFATACGSDDPTGPDDPDATLSVGELAAAVGLSRSQLHRRLVKSGGEAPGRMIRHLRLRRAADLLRDTNRPVAGIADSVGYEDPAHFTRGFKRRYGVTPSRYRDETRRTSAPG